MRGDRRLMLVGCYPPPWGGISVHLHALRALAGRAGVEASVLDIGEGHAERSGRDEIHDGGSQLRFLAGLIGAAARGDSLHVHIPGNNLKAWAVALAASRPSSARDRRLLTVHSGLAPALLDRSQAARLAARSAATGYRSILCTNAEIAAALQACGIPRSSLRVVNPFLAPKRIDSRAPQAAVSARRRFPRLLVAALAPGPQYGEAILLDALERLSARRGEVGCVVFGPGTSHPDFLRKLRSRGLEKLVVPLGEIDHEEALATIGMASIFVRPTLADGDSISVREALALGVAVVASDASLRPPGVMLFRTGDASQLAARIEETLSRIRRGEATIGSGRGGALDGEASILEAWRSIGLEVREPESPRTMGARLHGGSS